MPLSDRDYMKPSGGKRYSRGRSVFSSFAVDPVIVIIIVNLAIYLASLFNKNGILANMALSPLFVAQKPWTVITNMFVHIDFWHIFGNMLLLYFFGRIVYRMMGGWRFLIIYFVGGVVGNLLYLAIAEQLSFAWGASGAVYAIAGALVVMVPNMRVNLYFLIPIPLWVFVIVFLGILSIPPFAPYSTAWMAHLGGLAVGLIAGFIYRRQMRHIIYR